MPIMKLLKALKFENSSKPRFQLRTLHRGNDPRGAWRQSLSLLGPLVFTAVLLLGCSRSDSPHLDVREIADVLWGSFHLAEERLDGKPPALADILKQMPNTTRNRIEHMLTNEVVIFRYSNTSASTEKRSPALVFEIRDRKWIHLLYDDGSLSGVRRSE
jgi:hypothetical protein